MEAKKYLIRTVADLEALEKEANAKRLATIGIVQLPCIFLMAPVPPQLEIQLNQEGAEPPEVWKPNERDMAAATDDGMKVVDVNAEALEGELAPGDSL